MAPIQESEDFIRALSRIIFACIPPGQSTIKLSDPVTGSLDDYKLIKLSPAGESLSGYRGLRRSSPSKTPFTPPQVVLDDVFKLVNVCLGKENIPPSSFGKQGSVSSMSSQLQSLSRNKSKSRGPGRQPLAPKDPEILRIPTTIDHDEDAHDIPTPAGPLTRIKRAMSFAEIREDKRHAFTILPPAFRYIGKNSNPPPLDDSHPSDGDTSSSSPEHTPVKTLQFQDSSLDSSTGFGSSRSPSHLVGLGFTALVKDDGSPFDGLGMLTGRLYDNNPSPSDEARARARERRDRRIFGAAIHLRDDPGDKITPHLPSDSQSQTESGARSALDKPFAPSVKVSTPVSVNASERIPPAAPAKRLVGRLPLGVDERMRFRRGTGKDKRSERDVFAFQRERVSPEWQMESVQRLGDIAGSGRMMRVGVSSNKRISPSSLALSGTMGSQLRFWSYWMTPMNEASGGVGRPAWRP